MRTQKIKKWSIILTFWIIVSISFLFFSSLIILKANGFELNTKTWKLNKTGMIVLDGNPNGVVSIDGKKIKREGFPAKITGLDPGNYDVTVNLDKYQTWSKRIEVRGGQASVYDKIQLFLNTPTDTNAPEGLTKEALDAEYKNEQGSVTFAQTEILWQDKLVTRFSQDILAAAAYPDNNHIVFQMGSEIREMDLDGSNNILLFKLKNADPTIFSYRQGGNIIVYWDNSDNTAKAKIVR